MVVRECHRDQRHRLFSHTPQPHPTPPQGLVLTGRDLAMNNSSGAIYGGWLGAHAALGYTATEVALFQRNLIAELG